jgi:hypothetical protein
MGVEISASEFGGTGTQFDLQYLGHNLMMTTNF